jgi:Ca2+-binding EF-hand superfamily protein
MNSIQIRTTPHSRLLPIVQQIERKRLSHINDQEWEQLLKNAREDLQGFIDFEEYIETRFRQGNVKINPSFAPSLELGYLTYNMFDLAKSLDLDLFKFIEDFNVNLNYTIQDSKIELKPMINTLLQVDLDHLTEDDLKKLDSSDFTLLLSNDVENIILRYYYFQAFPNLTVESSLNISTRKLLFVDFNDLLYVRLPIDTLFSIINKKYRTLNKNKLYKYKLNSKILLKSSDY